jgi:glucose/arabinose dehydrogenase
MPHRYKYLCGLTSMISNDTHFHHILTTFLTQSMFTSTFTSFFSHSAVFMLLLWCSACIPAQTPPPQATNNPTPRAGTTWLTPNRGLTLQSASVQVPSQFRGSVGDNFTVNIPQGWTVRIFYAGRLLNKPRFMAWSPDSVLHIADVNAGHILALPDRNRDGIADTAIVAASGVFAHDVRFAYGAMYATEERRVVRFTDNNRDGIYETRSNLIENIAEGAMQPGGGHRTRTIVLDTRQNKLYLSIGSLCNVCREDFRAIIEEWDISNDGTRASNRRIFASGVRNAVGMALHPRTGKLWATNNGSDWQGNDIPPEWIDIVRPGGFYGYPFAHSYQMLFDFNAGTGDYRALLPITAADSARIRTMQPPAALITAHSAPMAIDFPPPSFPAEFRNGAFVALRGSWNRQPLTGYKVVHIDFDNDADTTANTVADVVTGFLTDANLGLRWARPVGVATDTRGNLYVGSDDITRFVMIVSPARGMKR